MKNQQTFISINKIISLKGMINMEFEYNYLLLQEEAEKIGRQDKSAVVVIGKFSPPQVGHYKLIAAAAKFMKEKKLDATIVCVAYRSKPKSDDIVSAIPVEDRISIMQNSGKANIINKKHFVPANGAFDAFVQVRKLGYEPIAICTADGDAEKSYLDILDKYFTNDDGSKIQHFSVGTIERNVDAQGENEKSKKEAAVQILDRMLKTGEFADEDSSATLARVAAEKGFGKEFVKILGLEKNIPLANKVFNQLRSAMGLDKIKIEA